MHYFSISGGPSEEPTKSASKHIMPNLCFCIQCDMQVTQCVLLHPGGETSTHYFSCSGRPSVDLTKNVDAIFFALFSINDDLVFLHLGRSVGDVLRPIVSEAQNVDELFFMIGWS
jgi:hypothetical protein